jgi:hypothetical protein
MSLPSSTWSMPTTSAIRAKPSTKTLRSGKIELGGLTTIKVTYYDVVGRDGQLAPFETFTLRRPRRD